MKILKPHPIIAVAATGAVIACGAAFAQQSGTGAQAPAPAANANSIQPETTLTISAEGEVRREPDTAMLNAGVTTQAASAAEAVAENAMAMDGVFAALKKAGVADRDLQTSNFSVQPQYDYSSRKDGEPPRITGYQATNQLSVKVRDLDTLGETLDAMVSSGGNTFNGLSFGLSDEDTARDEARRDAIAKAQARAELYADAVGMQVARIVTINESSGFSGPQPMAEMRMAASDASTKIARGEVGYTVNVNVTFELR
ncbi:SIMPL domain-containing protein [Henriciella litoralis]|uniref:SIMPL domain-containing protein n=1 Tax=Henriciella litoralis TaxID=568102 RepID=UPI000A078581|nr:SIMPL domain-containing protein [Henriciella litoralis]